MNKVAFVLFLLLGLVALVATIYIEYLFVRAGICP